MAYDLARELNEVWHKHRAGEISRIEAAEIYNGAGKIVRSLQVVVAAEALKRHRPASLRELRELGE